MFQKRKERNEVSDSPTPPSLDVYEVNTCRMSYRGDNKCVLTIQRKKERKIKAEPFNHSTACNYRQGR